MENIRKLTRGYDENVPVNLIVCVIRNIWNIFPEWTQDEIAIATTKLS